MSRIVIGNDHGAVELKKKVVAWLTSQGHEVVDTGVQNDESVDYPDMAYKACTLYLQGGYDFGILLCGTGIGISIAANKINGIRCALPQNIFAAKMAREHNNANFIAFGGRISYTESVEDMLSAFMQSSFLDGRHGTRVTKIMDLEKA